jgi:2-polyprenyl-3-methyl-5-hydroxy-6-metoxy-1,4-benzoquinol methylase
MSAPLLVARRVTPLAEAESSCPACGGGVFAHARIAEGLSTQTCEGCGLILSSMSRRKPKVGQYANVDLPAYLRSVGALRRVQSAEILDFLRPHAHAGARLLDVGCGFGTFLVPAKQDGYRVSGIEPDQHACSGACAQLGEGVVQLGTLLDVTPEPGSADVLSTLDVLEHVPAGDLEAFGRTVRNILTPGGLWVIKVPSTEGLYYRLSAALARVAPGVGERFIRRLWQTDYEFPHTMYFGQRSLARWLDRHGFSVVAVRYLAEVPIRNIIDRLSHDGDIGRSRAYALVPAVSVINAIEWARGRSDALVVLARRR